MKPLVIALALVSSAAGAQPVLTLDDALNHARKHNPDMRMAQAKLVQAEQVFGKVRANWLPKLTVGAGYTYNNLEATLGLPTGYYIRDTVVPVDQPPAGNPDQPWSEDNVPGLPTSYVMVPSGFLETTIQRHHQLGAQVELSQTILAPALIPALQSASIAADAARLSIDQARRELLFAVTQVYFGAVTAKEAWLVQERMLEAQLAHEKDAKVRFDAGAVPKLLLLRAQIDRARAEQDVLRAKGQYESALSTLAALLDREPDFDVVRPAEPPLPPQIEDIDQLASVRSDVEAAKLMLKIAEKDRTRNTLSYLPNIGFTAKYQIANVSGFTGEPDSWSLGVGLNWTLWDGGLREAERRELGGKLEEASASLAAATNKAKDEIRKALVDLSTARANRVKAEEQLKLAVENHQLVQVNYEAGVATAVEIADARAALLGAELSKLAETLNAEVAVLKLAKATGAFSAE